MNKYTAFLSDLSLIFALFRSFKGCWVSFVAFQNEHIPFQNQQIRTL